MKLDFSCHKEIRKLDVNEHKVSCNYTRWRNQFEGDKELLEYLQIIECSLRYQFGRNEIIEFYRNNNVHPDAKFLSAMIWGYEAPAGSKPDQRGPKRVKEMMSSKERSDVLANIDISTEKKILDSYRSLDKNIKKCGSSFLTKHLYFLGKSDSENYYPLILDDRVAVGLVKHFLHNADCLDLVSIHAQRKAKVYERYLSFAKEQAESIKCSMDQIEYFLFLKGGSYA